MTNRIITKRSTVGGEIPTAADLVPGELAVNTADGLIYTKHSDESIITVGSGSGGTTVGSSGSALSLDELGTFAVGVNTGDLSIEYSGAGTGPVARSMTVGADGYLKADYSGAGDGSNLSINVNQELEVTI